MTPPLLRPWSQVTGEQKREVERGRLGEQLVYLPPTTGCWSKKKKITSAGIGRAFLQLFFRLYFFKRIFLLYLILICFGLVWLLPLLSLLPH